MTLAKKVYVRFAGSPSEIDYADSKRVLGGGPAVPLDGVISRGDFCVDMAVCIGQLAAEYWDNLVEEYGAQLAAYALAIEKASGRKVVESWLFLPVAGGAARLAF